MRGTCPLPRFLKVILKYIFFTIGATLVTYISSLQFSIFTGRLWLQRTLFYNYICCRCCRVINDITYLLFYYVTYLLARTSETEGVLDFYFHFFVCIKLFANHINSRFVILVWFQVKTYSLLHYYF